MASEQETRQTSGARADARLKDVGERLEKEAQEIIDYLNQEVVPEVRKHSSRAMRAASSRLAEFADYLDKQKRGD